MSSGGPVEKVIWAATEANVINRIVIIVPIPQPLWSIDRSSEHVKDRWKRAPIVPGPS
jgi:hypothetical protein